VVRRDGVAAVLLVAVLLTGLHCGSTGNGASITAQGLDSLVTNVVKEVDP
jgi:hypothetical protein